MSVEQYLLSFDFDELTQSISDLQDSYTSLSEELKSASSSSSELVDKVGVKLESTSNKLNNSLQSMNTFYTNMATKFSGLVSTFKDLDTYSKSISDNLRAVQGIDLGGIGRASDSTAAERIEAISPGSFFSMSMDINGSDSDSSNKSLDVAKKAISAAKEAIEESQKAVTLSGKAAAAIKGSILKEASGAKSAIGGIIDKMQGGVGLSKLGAGGIISAIFSMAFLGVQWEQRKQAERGEMENAAEAGGGLYKKGVQKGIDWLAKFGEHAQFQFGISRQEIQKVVKQVSNLGIEINDTLTGTSSNFKDVENNTLVMSLAMDKHLNQAGGTSMQRAITLMENYGYSLEKAVTNIRDLSLAAKGSGMDIQKFINSIMESSSSLVQYQIDADDVVAVMTDIKSKYEELGIDPKRAGSMAAETTKGLASGMDKFSEGMQMEIAQKLGYKGDPIQAKQEMQQRYLEMRDPEDKSNFMIKFYQAVDDYLATEKGLSEDRRIYFYQQKAGMSIQQADYVAKNISNLDVNTRGAKKASKGELRDYKKAFETEGATLTDLYKSSKTITEELTKAGKGLIKILSGIYGILAVGIKSIIALLGTLGIEDTNIRQDVMAAVSDMAGKQIDLMADGMGDVVSGVGGALGTAGKFLDGVMKNWDEIRAFDPGGMISSLGERIEEISSDYQIADMKLGMMFDEANEKIYGFIAKAIDGIAGKGAVYSQVKELQSQEREEGKAKYKRMLHLIKAAKGRKQKEDAEAREKSNLASRTVYQVVDVPAQHAKQQQKKIKEDSPEL